MLKIGTRTSPLALAQTDIIVQALQKHHPYLREQGAVEIVPLQTQGDVILDKSLAELGGKGLFTKELEDALMTGRIDCAVHSLKDMPTILSPHLIVGAIVEREDPRDVFLSEHYDSLELLPKGSVIGTCSLRRSAFILHYYPQLRVQLLRGNVGSRIEKMKKGLYHGIILAFAGLKRLHIEKEIKSILPTEQFIPAPAQGVLAVECRKDDTLIRDLLQTIHHEPTFFTSQMERLFLSTLSGSCKSPVAAFLDKRGEDVYNFSYMLMNEDQFLILDRVNDLRKAEVPKAIQEIASLFKGTFLKENSL